MRWYEKGRTAVKNKIIKSISRDQHKEMQDEGIKKGSQRRVKRGEER